MGRSIFPTRRGAETAKCPYDVLVPYLAYLGRVTAERVGVHPRDVEVCEITFVEQMIALNERKLRHLIASGSFAWIHERARDHARTFRRNVDRRPRRE